MAPDCVFTHPLGTGRGRDAFYYMYRCATTWLAYDKLDFREAVVQVVGWASGCGCGCGRWRGGDAQCMPLAAAGLPNDLH